MGFDDFAKPRNQFVRAYKRTRGWTARLYSHPYNRQRPLSALARLAKWYAFKRHGQPRDFAFWGCRTIRCYPDSDGSMWLILNVIMDWNEFQFMRAYLRPTDTFFDVGANIGIYTLWASRFIDSTGHIIAFEPDPANLSRLREQLAINQLEEVDVVAAALADREGGVRFSQGLDMRNHVVMEADSTPFTLVPSTTLDTFCHEHNVGHVSLAKIDVEGAEQLVLAGASSMLAEHRIDVIQLEFNAQVIERGLDASATESILGQYGYRLYRFEADRAELIPVFSVDLSGHENLFAIENFAYVQQRLSTIQPQSQVRAY